MPQFLKVDLKNDSDRNDLHAYVTGLALQHGGQRCLMQENGKDWYFPKSPSKPNSHLTEECGIPLGPPGSTVSITLPQMAGGRIWICRGKLVFLLNPGPALVEPSVLNPSDPNAGRDFGFLELTLNSDQFFANISYVDFVPRIPISLLLSEPSGHMQRVAGLPSDGLDAIARDLEGQSQKDHQPWDKLIVKHGGSNLRVLSPVHGNAVHADFGNYYDEHIERVWHKYGTGSRMKIDTQSANGVLEGHVNKKGELVVGPEFFHKPSSHDVLGCNSGPFTTGPSAVRNAIIPRLAAALVRTCLLEAPDQPSQPNTYYKTGETNHYARIVHAHNLDGRGYSFAYDDVIPHGAEDQSGKVNAGNPTLFTVMFGGKSAAARTPKRQMPPHHYAASQRRPEYRRPPPIPPKMDNARARSFMDKMRDLKDRALG